MLKLKIRNILLINYYFLLKNEIVILKYPEIKELNKKYNLNIKDINIEKLDLSSKGIENDDIKYLEIFKELKELDLSYNNISDISVLEKVKFEKLEYLYLGWNKISNNINILENVNFKELKELYLHHNNISDISVLEKVKLEILDLILNNIDRNKFSSSVIQNLKLIFRL